MKKIVVYLIILFVIIGLSGMLYLFDRPLFEDNNQDNIETKNIESKIQDIDISSQSTTSDLKIENLYTLKEVEKHSSQESCWTIIRKEIYDLTQWVSKHPGGEKAILNICGKDGTDLFEKQHGGKDKPESALLQFKIGQLLE